MFKKVVMALLLAMPSVMASPLMEEGMKFASFLTIIALLITLPAFISLYLHLKKTNLGHMLIQPFLAMFIGFIAIMLNSILAIYGVFTGAGVDNISIVMSLNRAISSILIASGCVIFFFSIKNKGLFNLSYYQHKNHRHKHK